jgi:predicted permease
MQAELSAHIETFAEDLMAQGIPREDAIRRARVEFGTVNAIKDECRESVGLRWPFEIARDFRYAARVLWKSPAFTITSIATLALCIGANTAIFSVVDALLLRSLPYPQPDRLVAIESVYRSKGEVNEDFSVDGHTLEQLRASAALEAAGYVPGSGSNLVAGGRAENVRAQRITAGYFHVLGVQPAFGREFTSEEDRAGGPPAVIISHGLWNRLFHGDPAAAGRAIQLRGEPYTVVGVLPPSFRPLEDADIWTPLRPARTGEGEGTNYGVIARLKPSASMAQAQTEVGPIGPAAAKEEGYGPDVSVDMRVVPLALEFNSDVRSPLLVLWAAVVVVLIIGCVNIAGLLLVRGAARTREIGTRMALGSGRGAVIRQLLTETLVLSLIGGACGIALGRWGLEGLKLLASKHLDLGNVTLDGRVLLIGACASLLTGLLFGLVPALQASRVDIRTSLLEGGTRGVAGGRNQWTRRGLVIAEFALGVVLLVVAGLFIRTFAFVHNLDPGFDASHVLTATVSLQDARYATAQRVNRLYDETLRRIRELPGVEAAGVALTLPYERALNMGVSRVDGPHADKEAFSANLTYVTPGYIEALKIRVLRGRAFTDADNASSQPVAVVNEAFARRFLRDQDPIGSHLASGKTVRVIVGIAGNVQLNDSWVGFSTLSTSPGILAPASQMDDKTLQLVHTWFSPSWIVRTRAGRDGAIAGIERAVGTVDPQLPFASFRSMDEVISASLADQRFQAVLLGALASLALLLAAIGIYGLIANSVIERTRELGIRMALGASAWEGMRAVAMPGLMLALAGVIVGCLLARACVGVVSHLMAGVRPTDPATFAAAAIFLLLAAAAASLIPALRVTRLNPAETLRAE